MATRVKQEHSGSNRNPLSHVTPALIFAPLLEPTDGVEDAPAVPGSSQQDTNTRVVIKQEEDTAATRWIKLKAWLSAKWQELPAVPSVESRRAWAVARGIEPALVHKWFGSKKKTRKKHGKTSHPQDGYALDAHVPQEGLISPSLADKSVAPTPGPSSSSPPPQTPLDLDHIPHVAMASGTPLLDDLLQDSPRASVYSSAPLFNLPFHVPHLQTKAGPGSKTGAGSGLLPAPKITIKLSLKGKQEDLDGDGFDLATATPRTPHPPTKKRGRPPKADKASKSNNKASGSKPAKKKRGTATKVPEVKKEAEVQDVDVDMDMFPLPNNWNMPVLLDQNGFASNQGPNQVANPYPTDPMNFNLPIDPFGDMSYTNMLAAPFPTNNNGINQFNFPDAHAPSFNFTEPQGTQLFYPIANTQDPFSFPGSNFGNPNMFATGYGVIPQESYNSNPGLQFWEPTPQTMPIDYFLNRPLPDSFFQWP